MKFSDLYYANNDWDSLTVIDIIPGFNEDADRLELRKAMLKYSDYEVIGFSLKWAVLRASD